jgi:hypothetical protein
MHIDPVLVISILTTVMTGLASGTVHLTDMIPEQYVKRTQAWAGFFAFANSAVLTTLYGIKSAAPVISP